MLHLTPEPLQLFGCGNFGDLGLSHVFVEPLHEPGQRHAVLDVRQPLIFALYRILDGLGRYRGIGMLDQRNGCGDALQNCVVELAGIHQNVAVRREQPDIMIELEIGAQGHTVRFQFGPKLWAELLLIGIQHQSIL